MAISATILAAEVIGAVLSGSLALLADAGHMLSDVAGLGLALAATVLAAARPPTPAPGGTCAPRCWPRPPRRRCCWRWAGSWWPRRSSGSITPPAVQPGVMVVFGVIALAGDAVSVLVLAAGGRQSQHPRRVPGSGQRRPRRRGGTGRGDRDRADRVDRADPVASLLIGVLIVPRTVRLLREAVRVLMEAAPKDVDMAEVRAQPAGRRARPWRA